MVHLCKNTISDGDTLAFIRCGLKSISSEGREHLGNLAMLLTAIQNSPGAPVPDSISQEIIHEPTEELPWGLAHGYSGKAVCLENSHF